MLTTGCPHFLRPCCCWRGTCRVGLRWRGGGRRGRSTVVARSRPCGAAQRSCAGAGPLLRAGAQLPVDCISVLGGGWLVQWCCCGAATHATLLVAACNRRPPSSTSASTLGLSRPILPRRLRECCLLVLNLVSSTLPCIRQPRLRLVEGCRFGGFSVGRDY